MEDIDVCNAEMLGFADAIGPLQHLIRLSLLMTSIDRPVALEK